MAVRAHCIRIKRLLANTTRFLAGEISAADADDDAKADFLDGAIHHAPFADRLEEAVRKDPALADLTNDKGQRAIDLACLECRSAMQKALFFLGRYDVDKGPPEHRSATSLVVRAVDHEAADDYGKLFDEFDKDGSGTLDSNELGEWEERVRTGGEDGPGYGHLKVRLIELIEETFRAGRERREELLADPAEIDRLLASGAERARARATAVRDRALEACGLR